CASPPSLCLYQTNVSPPPQNRQIFPTRRNRRTTPRSNSPLPHSKMVVCAYEGARHAGGSPAFSFCFLYLEYQASMSGDIDIISSRKFLSTISDFAFAIHSGCDFG